MSYRGELPGFYWDHERRKYFAVTENHHAVNPAEMKYTKGSLAEAKRKIKKRKREEQRQIVRRRTTIQHFQSLRRPDIVSELGYRRPTDIIHERSQAYVRDIEPKVIAEWPGVSFPQSNIMQGREQTRQEIRCFSCDRDSGTVMAAVNCERDTNLVAYSMPEISTCGEYVYSPRTGIAMLYELSSLSSIDLNASTRTFVITSLGDKAPPLIHIGKLLEREKTSPPPHGEAITDHTSGIQFRPKIVSTIFTSSINPWGSNTAEHVAIGMSSETGFSILGTANDGHQFGNGWKNSDDMAANSDVLALDWLSPNLVAAGCRSGAVCLYDVRSQAGVKRMRHVSGILNLKRADWETRFVVAGMGGKMAMYDMRFLKETDAYLASRGSNAFDVMNVSPGKRKGKSRYREDAAMPVAKPYLTFQYDNDVQMLGMDVSPELGIVVTAERKCMLRAASLRSGKVVKEWRVGRQEDRIQCVKFVEDGQGVPRLLACHGVEITEFGLQDWRGWK